MIDLRWGLGPESYEVSGRDWSLCLGGGLVLASIVRRVVSVPDPAHVPVGPTISSLTYQDLVADWDRFREWLRREEPAREDCLDHARIAERLANQLRSDHGSIGLIGRFGSGKTTIVRWVQAILSQTSAIDPPRIWFCTQSCWGFENSAAAIEVILEKALETVDEHLDCSLASSLPETYRETFSGGGEWFAPLSHLFRDRQPAETPFETLDEMLRLARARLVIVIEDLDRTTGARFDRQDILALLFRLRVYHRISFVLTAGTSSASQIDFARLCDVIHRVPSIPVARVSEVVQAFRTQCLTRYPHINLIPERENPWDAALYTWVGRDTSLAWALSELLNTPRGLKHALRSTLSCWERTVGELDFDQLLAVQSLRHAAEEAFNFLLANRDLLLPTGIPQNEPNDDRRRRVDRLRQEWTRMTTNVDWNREAAIRLIEFVLPESEGCLREHRNHPDRRIQRLSFERYWNRAIHEELGSHEVPDQWVLGEDRGWRDTGGQNLGLIEGLLSGGDYVAVWESLVERGQLRSTSQLLELSGCVIRRLLERDGNRASGSEPHPAMLALWRQANRTVERGEGTRSWLEQQLRLTIPASLTLANDLYYYWGSENHSGILRAGDRAIVRNTMVDLIRSQITDGDSLVRILNPDVPWSLYQLIIPPRENEAPSVLSGVSGWGWFAPIVADVVGARPDLVVYSVLRLFSERRETGSHFQVSYQINTNAFQSFFGTRAPAITEMIRCFAVPENDHDFLILAEAFRNAVAAN